jgi:probable HAF family extracellular repeat protein
MSELRLLHVRRLLAVCLATAAMSSVFSTQLQAAKYKIEDLGTLGGPRSVGHGINSFGHVVGQSTDAQGNMRAFVYDGVMRDLGTLGGRHSTAYSINDLGQIAGEANLPGDDVDPFLRHAFLYDGTMHDLGTLGGSDSVALSISQGGTVVGVSGTGSARHAFRWAGSLQDLGALGGAESIAIDINNAGQIVGSSITSTPGNRRAFLYTSSGGMIDLNSLIDPSTGWLMTSGNAINDAGHIAGNGRVGKNSRGFFYDGAIHDLGTLGGTGTEPYDVNADGTVVGVSSTEAGVGRGFVFSKADGIRDLNALIEPLSGWQISRATAINARGQITGQGFFTGEVRAFLMTPVPEPDASIVGTVGLAMCIRLRKCTFTRSVVEW